MRYVPDVDMPADCLTKWIGAKKLEMSMAFMMNTRAARAKPYVAANGEWMVHEWDSAACVIRAGVGSGGVSAGETGTGDVSHA